MHNCRCDCSDGGERLHQAAHGGLTEPNTSSASESFELLWSSATTLHTSLRFLSSPVTVPGIPGKEQLWDYKSPQTPHQHLPQKNSVQGPGLVQTIDRGAEKDQFTLSRILLVWTSFWQKQNIMLVLKDPGRAFTPKEQGHECKKPNEGV